MREGGKGTKRVPWEERVEGDERGKEGQTMYDERRWSIKGVNDG